ncbi:hypothetical protein HDV05_005699, partial [Chytridiales sp. JEL 0842]
PKWFKAGATQAPSVTNPGTNQHLYKYKISDEAHSMIRSSTINHNKADESGAVPNLSCATAFKSTIHKDTEYLCFGYGDGIIGLRRRFIKRGWEEVDFYIAHRNTGGLGGEIVGCEYVPLAPGRGGYRVAPRHDDVVGVIVSAARNGTVLVMDCFSKEVCAAFNAGGVIKSMAVHMPTGKNALMRISISKADGSITCLKYYPC